MQSDLFNFINEAILSKSTETIELHLRIAYGRDRNALAVFVVDDVHGAVRVQKNAVRSTEAFRDPIGKVHALLQELGRIWSTEAVDVVPIGLRMADHIGVGSLQFNGDTVLGSFLVYNMVKRRIS